MKYTYTVLALVGTSFAQLGNDAYISSVCMPQNSTGYPDLNAPCNAVSAIEAQCIYGPAYLQQILSSSPDAGGLRRRSILKARQSSSDSSDDDGPPPLSNTTQQICFCESQFFDQANGCAQCFTKHGDPEPELSGVSGDSLASLSSSYCAASNTPTAGFADILFDYGNSVVATLPVTTMPYTQSRDPLGNMTQVSLYFTPSVTGTAAWLIPTQTGSAVNTEDGQIRPTAAGGASGQRQTTGSTTTSGNAAMRTEAVAAAGMIGLAGLVALL